MVQPKQCFKCGSNTTYFDTFLNRYKWHHDQSNNLICRKCWVRDYNRVFYTERGDNYLTYLKVWKLEHPNYMKYYMKVWYAEHPNYDKIKRLERLATTTEPMYHGTALLKDKCIEDIPSWRFPS